MSKVLSVGDNTFETEVLRSSIPVLVDFWAEWCGPCKMLAPILESVVDDFAGKIKIVKLNVDEHPETAPKFGIRGIPTLIMFKNGEVLATKVGAMSKAQLTDFLNEHAK